MSEPDSSPVVGFPIPQMHCYTDAQHRTPEEQMAVDEVALRTLPHPWLRLYRWAEPAVSIGYFGDRPEESWLGGREWVRRWTGGGVVEHGSDLTFSLTLPRGTPGADWRPQESYCNIHRAVAQALEECGVRSEVSTEAMPGAPASRACFVNPVASDLLVEGAKIVGGAQRRSREGLLHQGSIQGLSSAVLAKLEVALPRVLGGEVREWSPTASFEEAVDLLARSRYGADSWRFKA